MNELPFFFSEHLTSLFILTVYFALLTSTDSLSCLFVSSVVLVSTIGPESSTTLPSSNTICRLTRVSMCRVVVSSVFFFVTTSSAKYRNENENEFEKMENKKVNRLMTYRAAWFVRLVRSAHIRKWMNRLVRFDKSPKGRQSWTRSMVTNCGVGWLVGRFFKVFSSFFHLSSIVFSLNVLRFFS